MIIKTLDLCTSRENLRGYKTWAPHTYGELEKIPRDHFTYFFAQLPDGGLRQFKKHETLDRGHNPQKMLCLEDFVWGDDRH